MKLNRRLFQVLRKNITYLCQDVDTYFIGIVQNNSILVLKVEYFYTSLLPLYINCKSFLCIVLYSFLHAERNEMLCEEDEILCQSFIPEEPHVRYTPHVM